MVRGRAVIIGLLVGLLSVGGLAGQVYQKGRRVEALARSARDHLEHVQRLLPNDPWALREPNALVPLTDELARACDDLDQLASELDPLRLLGHLLPLAGPHGQRLAQVVPVVQLGQTTCRAAETGLAAAQMALEPVQHSDGLPVTEMGPALLEALARADEALPDIQRGLDEVVGARGSVQRQHLDGWMAPAGELVDRLDAGVDRARRGLNRAVPLPRLLQWLLGAEGPMTYLVLGQTSHELRATGGFISSVGAVTVDRGRLQAMDFRYSFDWDSPARPRVPPPWPFERYMAFGGWFMRDANWWPDFPSSARQVLRFWAMDQGTPVHGVLAIDEEVVRAVLEVVGPVQLPGWGLEITASDFLPILKEATGLDHRTRFRERSGLVPAVYGAVSQRLLELDVGQAPALAATLGRLLEEKHIQFYLDDPDAQAVVSSLGWDGSVQQTADDYLFVVDTTVSYSEVNQFISKEVSYDVRWSERQDRAERTLVIRYRNSFSDQVAAPWEQHEAIGDFFDPASWSMQRVAGFWGNWFRVYVPAGSELLAAEGLEEPAETYQELGKQVFAGYFGLRPGETHTVMFRYRGPPASVPETGYRLLVQKQAGAPPYPVWTTVRWPGGSSVQAGPPQPLVLRKDEWLHVPPGRP